MTKTTCKKIISFIGLLALFVPVAVFAVEENPQTRFEAMQEKRSEKVEALQEKRADKIAEGQERRQEAFCDRFSNQASQIASNMAERRNAFEERKGNRFEKMNSKRDSRNARFEDKHSSADERRSKLYAQLEEKADTDAKKMAIVDFKKTVETAVEVRRNTVKDAVEAFRQEVDEAIAGRKDAMQSTADNFSSAVNTALDTAKAACAAGDSREVVRTNFRSALLTARASLKTDRSASEKVGMQVKALAELRRSAVKKALADFKTTLQGARDTLKLAFGNSDGV